MEKFKKFKISNKIKKSKCCESDIYKAPDFYTSSEFDIKEVDICTKCGKKC